MPSIKGGRLGAETIEGSRVYERRRVTYSHDWGQRNCQYKFFLISIYLSNVRDYRHVFSSSVYYRFRIPVFLMLILQLYHFVLDVASMLSIDLIK